MKNKTGVDTLKVSELIAVYTDNKIYSTQKNIAKKAVVQLDKTKEMVEKLAQNRLKNKMSASRINAVAKEINQLIKVISEYC